MLRLGTSRPLAAIAVAAFCLLSAVPAPAQPSNVPSNVLLDAPGLLVKKPKPGAPDVKGPPVVWPRLDPGAVFCRSADDLRRLAARRAGEDVTGPVDCQIIRTPVGISILQREGPGMVQVQTTDPRAGGVGWTDAWLPSKEPTSRAAAR
jgi:hypothetical protein